MYYKANIGKSEKLFFILFLYLSSIYLQFNIFLITFIKYNFVFSLFRVKYFFVLIGIIIKAAFYFHLLINRKEYQRKKHPYA